MQPESSSPETRYQVTARKYRPRRFSDLVAQEHVTETLRNALRLERLAHAYLFSGPRGIGKTTAARILAKAINCTTPRSERTDEAEPCRACESCRSFEEGRSLGIFELDAASNNKVDDIRDLRETVRIPPQGTRKKVYIIDEVHMLSHQAFNALLKTLEEPPPHVLFIFATTEPRKVLPTIRSRCQRFDFRRIPVPAIVEHLRSICKQEGVEADDASLMLLARKGDGALRDALSIFDQAVSLCGNELTYSELAQALGVVDRDLFFRVTSCIKNGDSAGMLRLVEEVVSTGHDLQDFLGGLGEHLRNLLVAASMEDSSLIEATEAMRRRYVQTAEQFSEADLLRLLQWTGEAQDKVKSATQPRLRLEMALLQMATLPRAADLQKVLQKIDRLEQIAGEGRLPDTLPDGDSTNDSGDRPAREAPPPKVEIPPNDTPSAADEPPAEEDRSHASEAAGDDRPGDDPRPSASPEPSNKAPEPDAASQQDAASQSATASEPDDSPEAAPEYDDLFGPPALRNKETAAPYDDESPSEGSPSDARSTAGAFPADRQSPRPPDHTPDSPSRKTSPHDPDRNNAPPTGTLTTETGEAVATAPAATAGAEPMNEHWSTFVQEVRSERIDVGSYLKSTRPAGLESSVLTLAVPSDFGRRFLHDHRALLLASLPAPIEARQLRFVVDEQLQGHGGDGSSETPPDPRALVERLREDHPVVKALFEEFGGELMW